MSTLQTFQVDFIEQRFSIRSVLQLRSQLPKRFLWDLEDVDDSRFWVTADGSLYHRKP
ncbi:hypothetical protein LTR39_004957, partial [Cryomyces antarcticus]